LARSDFTSTAGMAGAVPEVQNPGSATLQLGFPRRNLIGVNIKVLG